MEFIFKVMVFGLILFCVISCRDLRKFKNDIRTIAEVKHNGLHVSLLKRNANLNEKQECLYFLRISEEKVSYEVLQYLSYRNDPVLSEEISFVSKNHDTIHPISTLVEKGYEVSNAIIYLIALPNTAISKNMSFFIVTNFLAPRDTLLIDINKE